MWLGLGEYIIIYLNLKFSKVKISGFRDKDFVLK